MTMAVEDYSERWTAKINAALTTDAIEGKTLISVQRLFAKRCR